jgi:hypothetical protein
MTTATFKCSHCQKLLAVKSAYLGQSVRCPHCQQVVTAPASVAAASAPVPLPLHFSDDRTGSLFGDVLTEPRPDAGRLPSPAAAAPSSPPAAPPPPPAVPPVAVPPPAGLEATQFTLPPPSSGPAATASTTGPVAGLAGSTDGSVGLESELPPLSRPRTPAAARSSGRGMAVALGLLAGYSLVMTIVAVRLWSEVNNRPSKFEALPDVLPESRPAFRVNSPPSTEVRRPRTVIVSWPVQPEAPLPAKLIVPLGQSLTVGDLQFTAEGVEVRRPIFMARNANWRPEPAPYESLLLHVRLKNVSRDVVFRPLEASFARRWKEGSSAAAKPFTLLEVGDIRRFYGSAFDSKGDSVRECFEGQQDDERLLYPGEEIKSVIVTDPNDRVPEFLRAYPDIDLLWRVHVRRGLIRHNGRDISTTTVIGVRFNARDIRR